MDTYIKDNDGILAPLNADLTILRIGDVIVKEAKHGVAFFFLVPDDARGIYERGGQFASCVPGMRVGETSQNDAHRGLTKRHFSPVTGCVLTTGWTLVRPVLVLSLCSALNPCKRSA